MLQKIQTSDDDGGYGDGDGDGGGDGVGDGGGDDEVCCVAMGAMTHSPK